MANGNGKTVGAAPVAANDFFKSNGLDRAYHEVHPVGASMTRQEFADECDINSIMAKYDGFLSDPMKSLRGEPQYIDFTAMPATLMDAMDVFRRGEEAFMRLPAVVRKEFDNNPAAFVDFASDPENLPQMRTWDLAPPAPVAPAVVAGAPGVPGAGVGAAGAAPAPQGAPVAGNTPST